MNVTGPLRLLAAVDPLGKRNYRRHSSAGFQTGNPGIISRVNLEIEPGAIVEPLSPSQPNRWTAGTLVYTTAGLAVLFFWLLWGDFSQSMKDRAIFPVAQVMLRGFSAPDWLVGLLVGSVPAGIGMVLAPIVSVKSDRHRGPWGRRIPFLLLTSPVILLSMFGLGVAPALGASLHAHLGPHSPGEMICKVAAFGVFWTIFEIATVTITALFGALINDVVPRQIMGRFFALFRAVSLIAGVIFNYYLMGKAEHHYFGIFFGLGLLYAVGFTQMCLKVREGDYPPPPPREATGVRARAIAPILSYLKECFSKPYYLCFFLATTLGLLSFVPVNTFSVYHARSLNVSDDHYGKSLALSYAISLVLSYPIGILADRFHPLRLGIIVMTFYSAVTLYGFLFATGMWTFFAAFVLHTVVSGAYFTGTASIGQRLLPRDRFAEFASAAGIVGAVCFMILPPTLGMFIQHMHHNYRYVFLLGSILSGATVAAYVGLFVQYLKLGGDAGYVAPE